MSKARDLANGATALSAVSATELGYLDGVTSAVQTQLNNKQTANAAVSTTELGYLDGVTSAIQTQLNQKPEVVAGKNVIINGGFDIWQRGTTGVGGTGAGTGFVTDRWQGFRNSYSAGMTISQQSPGSTLSQFRYCIRAQRDSGNTSTSGIFLSQQIETSNAILYAGQSITLSYYARAGATFSGTGADRSIYWGTGIDQNGSTGAYTGSTQVTLTGVSNPALSTSWQRYIFTGTIGSTATQMYLTLLYYPTGTAGATDYIEYAGVQLEAGSTATPFSRNGGTIQGELAACQRYYYRRTSNAVFGLIANGAIAASTTAGSVGVNLPVTLRTKPVSAGLEYANLAYSDGANITNLTGVGIDTSSTTDCVMVTITVASGLTQYRPYYLSSQGALAGYIGISAEL